MVIDTDTMRPALGGVTGGLSGPAIRPVAVRCVWQVAQCPATPADSRHGRHPLRPRRAAVHPRRCVGGVGRHRGLRRPVGAGARARRTRAALDERGFASSPTRSATRTGRATRNSFRYEHTPRNCSAKNAPHFREDPVSLRQAARRRARRARLAVRRHRPAPGTARRPGGLPTTPTGWPASPTSASRRFAGTAAVIKPQSGVLRAVRRRAASPCSNAPSPHAATPARSSSSTSSAATSAPRWPATRAPTSTRPRRSRATRSPLSPYLGVGSLAAGLRAVRAPRRRRVRARADVQSGRPAGAARPASTTDARWRRSSIDELAARNAGADPMGSLGVVVGATIGDGALSAPRRAQRPVPRARHRRPGRHGRRRPAHLRRRRCATSSRACRARCCGTVRTRRACAPPS